MGPRLNRRVAATCPTPSSRYNRSTLPGPTQAFGHSIFQPLWPLLPVVGCVLLLPFMGAAGGAQDGSRIRALIVDGVSNHDWRKTTEFIRGTLVGTGLFKVMVTTTPDHPEAPEWDGWRPRFSSYDVVVVNWNNVRHPATRWPAQVERDLETYVRRGGGLLAFHSANNAFAHWPAYDRMIGIGWRGRDHGVALELEADGQIRLIPAGEGEKTSHGPRQDTQVIRLADHPITRGTPKRWMTPDIEVYTFARGPAEDLTVLTYGLHKATRRYWPLEWVVSYGRGRVYSSSFGHIWKTDVGIPDRVLCVGFQTSLIRAAEWLGTGAVTHPVPEDFPSEDAIVLRDR